MNPGGDAAEQVVRLSLEGMEVAVRLSGTGAKNLAVLLATVLKEEQKTKGKARLTNMIKSGKELKVFSLKNQDLKKFSEEAKRYGVLYCVLKDKGNKDPNTVVDVIARAEDAPKIQRIMERFDMASIDRDAQIKSVERDVAERRHKDVPKEVEVDKSPFVVRAEGKNPSVRDSQKTKGLGRSEGRTSVREKLAKYKSRVQRDNAERAVPVPKKEKGR